MFNRKKKNLELEIFDLTGRLESAERRLRQLECPHSITEFKCNYIYLEICYIEECVNCGKIINRFYSELEFEKAKLKVKQGCAESIKEKIKKLEGK